MYMHKFVRVHAHFNFALLRKFYGVFSTYKSHCRSHRAAATALPPSRCVPPQPPLPLPPPQRRRQAVTNVALSRCRHSLAAAKLPLTSRFCAAATAAAAALLPPRCRHRAVRRRQAAAKLPPSCRRPRAVTLPPPPPPRRRLLVGCLR
jgi:hypothetical protein